MQQQHMVTEQSVQAYLQHLRLAERAPATVRQYGYDLCCFGRDCAGMELTKETVIAYKTALTKRYAPASVNRKLAAINGYLAFVGRSDCRVRPLRIQRSQYCDTGRELSREEYCRLLAKARQRGDERLYYLIETICATGIRVSELPSITVRALQTRQAVLANKGKCRTILLPQKLCEQLKAYCRRRRITGGSVFITRSGQPINRTNIWAMMKALARRAGVALQKVFPHNLRHLFARTFYQRERDIDHLAAILGHSSVNTTRIYTRTSGEEHRRQLEGMPLIL